MKTPNPESPSIKSSARPLLGLLACLSCVAGTAEPQPALPFLDDVSLWHSEVNLHEDHAKSGGRYIDGLVIGNGDMLVIEGMTTEITRFDKSRVTDSRLHGSRQFTGVAGGAYEHLSRSPKVPLHALAWVAGPVYTSYATTYGFTFGAEYQADGHAWVIDPTGWDRERQYRLRRTNIAKNVVESGALRVTAVDFMPPDLPAFIRRITIANTGATPLDQCRFNVGYRIDPRCWTGAMSVRPARTDGPVAVPELDGNEPGFYLRQVQRTPKIADRVIERSVLIAVPSGKSRPDRLMLIHSPDASALVTKQFLEFDLGRLAPGESRTVSVQIVTAFGEESLAASFQRLTATPVDDLLRATHAHWQAQLVAADRLATPLRRDITPVAADYVDSVRTFLLSLHTRDGGSIAHPYSYNYVFTRDGYDTYRAMLALGHQEVCRRSIGFLQQAMHRLGLAMSYSPEEFHWAAGGPSRFDKVNTFGHFTTSEYMLFFPVMVRDYVERFGDDSPAHSFYAEMKRSLEAQPLEGEGLVAYSGDEISVKRGKPLYKYSPQNAALYVRGAEFVARFAEKLGHPADAATFAANAQKVRTALERRFWDSRGFYAYSVDVAGRADDRVNIYCQALPFSYGYLTRDDARLPAIAASVKRENMFPSHRASTMPIAGQTSVPNSGNSSGLLLYVLTLSRDPAAAAVFDRMLGDAGSMGTTGEYLAVTNDSLTRGERLRPHETSYNLLAAIEYLRADPAP